jgi:hypothetical protein
VPATPLAMGSSSVDSVGTITAADMGFASASSLFIPNVRSGWHRSKGRRQ